MSLLKEDFLREWMKLEGSFARGLSGKIRDAWYEEVELTEYHIFKKTIWRLSMGYHFTAKSSTFPRFKDFWTIYSMVKKDLVPEAVEEKKGCKMCVEGLIYFLKKFPGYKVPHEVVGFCRNCHPDRLPSLDPEDSYNYGPNMHPYDHQHRLLLPEATNRGLYLDFMEKFRDPATDWEAETKKALKMHHEFVKARGLA